MSLANLRCSLGHRLLLVAIGFSHSTKFPIIIFPVTRARHGFANPRGYPGMGGTGTGTGRLKVTHRKPTPVARGWRVFPGTQITKHHMRHISLPPPTSIRPQTQQHAQDMSPNTTTRRWGGGEKDEGGDGPSCPSP